MADKGKATQLGIAQVPVRATMDLLDKDLNQAGTKVERGAENITKRASGILGKIGESITNGIGIALGERLVSLGEKAAGALVNIVKNAMPLENVKNAFAGISGNAQVMLDTLKAGSLGMVKDADLMASYNTAAQLVGKTFADQLPGAMKYLAKVSAATGQDMGFMLDSLVKGVGRLSPMILDNLGIQVSLEEATAKASKMYGVETDALSKAQIQAGMMNVVLEKLQTNTAKMPEVVGTTAQKWAVLQIKMQNWKDRAGLALLPVLTKLLDPLLAMSDRVLPKLTGFIESTLVPKLQKIIHLAGGLSDLWTAAGGDPIKFIDLLRGRLTKIGEELGFPREKLDEFLLSVSNAAKGVVGFVDDTKDFVEKHGPAIKDTVQKAVDVFTDLKDIVVKVVDWIGPKTKQVIDDTTKSYNEFKTNVLEPWAKAWDAVKSAIQGAIDKIREWMDANRAMEGAGQIPQNEQGQTPFGFQAAPLPQQNPQWAPPSLGFAAGGDFVVRTPTPIWVGEKYQAERVRITPLSGSGGTAGAADSGGYHFTYNDYSGMHRGRAEDMSRQLEHRYLLGLN